MVSTLSLYSPHEPIHDLRPGVGDDQFQVYVLGVHSPCQISRHHPVVPYTVGLFQDVALPAITIKLNSFGAYTS
jgi:hypothetical protein